MPDKETGTCRDNRALELICTCLGQIPVTREPFSASKLPIEWESFSSVEWESLLIRAQAEGLAPLMYWVLSKSGKFPSIPESAQTSLRHIYSSAWMNNHTIFKELTTLAKRFSQAEIPAVVLKGACFALTIYPDIGLRPMGDLDLLVSGLKLSAAVGIARSLGYEDTVPEASPGLGDLLRHEIGLQKTGSPSIRLELHHSLVANRSFSYAVPVDWFWEQTEPLDASESNMGLDTLLMLTPTAQVLYSAAHAMLQHGGKNAPLRWFYDLDRLIRVYAGRLDWDLLLYQARLFDWGSALAVALLKTVACFHTPVPEHVIASLSENYDKHRHLVALKQVQPATHVLDKLQYLRSLNGYARFRTLLATIIPSPAYMRWRYHIKTSRALPAYYLLRWWGILKDGLHTVVLLAQKHSRLS